MKTNSDPRHHERIKIMQDLFAFGFEEKSKLQSKKAPEILQNIRKIDQLIASGAPSWPIEKINRIDLAILRLALFELIIEKKTPPKVVVDEAIELGKEFGSDTSASFINGALGKIIKDQRIIAP